MNVGSVHVTYFQTIVWHIDTLDHRALYLGPFKETIR